MKKIIFFILFIFSKIVFAKYLTSSVELAKQPEKACSSCLHEYYDCALDFRPSEKLKMQLFSFETYELTPISSDDGSLWLSEATRKGEPDTPPPNTVPVLRDVIKHDLVGRSVYLTCDKKFFYILDRGGLIDQFLWFGPFELAIDTPE